MKPINEVKTFDTITETLNWLQEKGYDHDFNLDSDCIRYSGGKGKLMPEEFHIDQMFRFEGETDPSDESVIYAISSSDQHVKGTLINAFGTYANTISEKIIDKLALHE